MTISAVIGANYGDEGKGLVTDYLSGPDTLVVRFNGGSQAGHTVVDPDGRRHVFHHFGSGTLRGAETLLSRFFIINPIMYRLEHEDLLGKKVKPRVLVDPLCPLTTPFDMMLNQAAEAARGSARHGSCGLGINETIRRNDLLFGTTAGLLRMPAALRIRLRDIRDNYVPLRARELGIKELPESLKDEGLIERYLEDAAYMLDSGLYFCPSTTLEDWSNIVFEGAQGLRLDECSPDFPYVTRSRTGLTNVRTLLKEAGRTDTLEAYYVTRPYITRHGAGPLRHELPVPPYAGVVDATNIPNRHQGILRFGHFDVDDFLRFVKADFEPSRSNAKLHLALTCLDQLECGVTYFNESKQATHSASVFSGSLTEALQAHGEIISYGPTRNDIKLFPF